MSWRFRKRIKVIPGLYLNLTKKGISTTIGPRHFSVNVGSKGAFLNTGIPGTGLYNRIPISTHSGFHVDANKANEVAEKLKYILEQTWDGSEQIKSASIEQLTSGGLESLKTTIIAAHQEYTEISTILADKKARKIINDNKLSRLQKSLFKFLYKRRIERLSLESQDLADEIAELNEQKDLSTVELNIFNDETFESLYADVEKSYQLLINCSKIWDITTSKEINRAIQRSFAGTEIRRVEVNAFLKDSGLITTKHTPLKLCNKNGGDLYFYPGFVIIHEQLLDFAILDYAEFDIAFTNTQFVESESVPTDAEQIGHTWAKVNKDGSPDRRFRDNYQIPLIKYGQIDFLSTTGLKESYLFSNVRYSNLFFLAMKDYITAIKTANKLLKQFN